MIERLYTFEKIDTPELLQEAYRLRFQVYCKECDFIREEDYPLGYETDAFDRYSVHFGAFDLNDQLVGAVRLILPSSYQFPIEDVCPGLEIARFEAPRSAFAEISRLTISKIYRRRTNYGSPSEALTEKPTAFIGRVSPIAIGLCRALYQECLQQGIRYCLALMEEPLKILVGLHGFVFEPIGPKVDFYGPVTPYLIDVGDLEKRGVFRASGFNPQTPVIEA